MYDRFSVYLIVGIFLCAPLKASSATEDLDNLEKNILSSRQAITSGRFRVVLTHVSENRPTLHDEIITWIDGRKVREDRIINNERTETKCFGDEWYFQSLSHSGQFDSADRTKWPHVKMRRVSDVAPNRPDSTFFRPLVIMLYPGFYGFSNGVSIESLLRAGGRSEISCTRSVWRGHATVDVTFVMWTDHQYSYTVVPSLGYSIVRMRLVIRSADRKSPVHEYLSESSPIEVIQGFYFPRSVETREFKDQKEVESETVEIEVGSLNQRIDPSVFDVSTARVPPNVVVKKFTGRGVEHLIWDGHAIRPLTPQDVASIQLSRNPIEPHKVKTRKWVTVMIGSSLIILGVFTLLGRRWRTKRVAAVSMRAVTI